MVARVNSAKLSAIAHATEDSEKVVRALGGIFPETLPSKSERHALKGHFGNRIVTINRILRGRAAESLLESFWGKLSLHERETVIAELETRLDEEGRLHLRMDKQSSLRGVLRLKEDDPIKVEIAFQARSDLINQIREFLRNLKPPKSD